MRESEIFTTEIERRVILYQSYVDRNKPIKYVKTIEFKGVVDGFNPNQRYEDCHEDFE